MNTTVETTTHSIDASDNLITQVIEDQTDNLEKGWREIEQNGIDSGADNVSLEYTHQYTYAYDDGGGVELGEARGIELVTVFGESSKDSESHETIGEFGVGIGQVIAKGITAFISDGTVVFFDIKNWGLEAKRVAVEDAVAFIEDHSSKMAELIRQKIYTVGNLANGLHVLLVHYESEVPAEGSYKWDRYEESLRERFQYLNTVKDTNLYLNDELISDEDWDTIHNIDHSVTEERYSHETGCVYYALKHGSGDLTVYSGGVKVTSIDGRGLEGVIITERNLQLNFARNEIKSGCPIFTQIQDELVEYRKEIFDMVDRKLNKDAREFFADRIFNHNEVEEYGDKEIFKTAGDDMVSWNDIMTEPEIGFAPSNDLTANKLEDNGHTVLAEHDTATKRYQSGVENVVNNDSVDIDIDDAPDEFDVDQQATDEGIHSRFEDMAESELRPRQYKKLGIARYMMQKIDSTIGVRYGESDVNDAWTDGTSHITITDSAATGSTYTEWLPQLWETLIGEYVCKESNKHNQEYSIGFNRRYRKKSQDYIYVLSDTQRQIRDNTLTKMAQRGHRKATQ